MHHWEILPIESVDYTGQRWFSKDNNKSVGARLITSLSRCIISQSTCAVNSISIASVSVRLIQGDKNVRLVLDAHNVWRSGSSLGNRPFRRFCYRQFSFTAKCNFTVCPEPLSSNVPHEDKKQQVKVPHGDSGYFDKKKKSLVLSWSLLNLLTTRHLFCLTIYFHPVFIPAACLWSACGI